MIWRLAVSAAILGSTLAVLIAQVPAPGTPAPGQRPPILRPGQDPQNGSAVIRGYVVAADTGNPIRRAFVRAMSAEGRNSGFATTDADGRFEITNLAGGRYNVMVSKAGYVGMSYGQRRPEQPGTLLEIVDGAVVEKVAFSLPRGGVVTGSILDEFGDPLAGAMVSAMRFRYFAGGRRLAPSGSAQSDDRGVFRIYGLPPGEYYIAAVLRESQMTMVVPGSTTGSAPVQGYAPTYYPGTPNVSEASRVIVKAAQEATNVSMALSATRLARISGRAMNSRGAPVVQSTLMARPADRMSLPMIGAPALTGVDGSFQIPGLPPGTYTLTLMPRSAGPDAEFANMRLTVGSTDIDGVLVTTAPGAIARGVITTDEGTAPPVLPEQVSVFARDIDPEPVPMFGGNAGVKPDWTFELTGLSGLRVITASVAQTADWMVKQVFHNGQDVTDAPVEFHPGHTVEGLAVVLTRKLTHLSGQITGGERNLPETDATVIAFSEDPNRWTFGTRFLRTARPNQDGRYTLRGLPPHDYLVVAVKDLEPGQFQDPEFLDSVRPQAVRVSLAEGETRVQDLKVARQ